MNTKEYSREVEIAQISAIMSDYVCKELYEKMNTGYISVTEQVARWAVEFYEKHINTKWEDILDNGFQALSVLYAVTVGRTVICWDDAVIDFAYFKMEQI